jgi:dTDP-4-dehydrorhamnose 3,5-epimerase
MRFLPTPLSNAYIIELSPLQDERGMFMRYFCKNEFKQIGHEKEFVQFNHSINTKAGTLRGLHFQVPPNAETKLIRCIAGSVFDVVVDLRKGSSTFLHWFGTELSKENKRVMYIPEGFAHGFVTLSDGAELLYHHTEFYTPMADRGLRFDDPLMNIKWPMKIEVISAKDSGYQLLKSDFKGITLEH